MSSFICDLRVLRVAVVQVDVGAGANVLDAVVRTLVSQDSENALVVVSGMNPELQVARTRRHQSCCRQ